ncbi:hypothetical protein [Paenibacillus tuaregi]|uniref:hypothetical protein n=1 Tax=Paenibacillus tuaregi TaxID=1816681 RepID=UPI000838C7AE|nr:hypothetical protein [Paenibacillus tuaregi]
MSDLFEAAGVAFAAGLRNCIAIRKTLAHNNTKGPFLEAERAFLPIIGREKVLLDILSKNGSKKKFYISLASASG